MKFYLLHLDRSGLSCSKGKYRKSKVSCLKNWFTVNTVQYTTQLQNSSHEKTADIL